MTMTTLESNTDKKLTLEELYRLDYEGYDVGNYIVSGITLYTGTRQKKTIQEIKKEGFCTFSPEGARRRAIDVAEKALGRKLTDEEYSEVCFYALPDAPSRWSVYATMVSKETACSWAERNPECVYLSLIHCGLDHIDAVKWLEKEFGLAYAVTLKNVVVRFKDIYHNEVATGLKCISPDQIGDIVVCSPTAYTIVRMIDEESAVSKEYLKCHDAIELAHFRNIDKLKKEEVKKSCLYLSEIFEDLPDKAKQTLCFSIKEIPYDFLAECKKIYEFGMLYDKCFLEHHYEETGGSEMEKKKKKRTVYYPNLVEK